MENNALLSVLGDWAAILTCVLAVLACGRYLYRNWSARRAVEAYLESVSMEGEGMKSVLHLMRQLSMTEADVTKACFDSACIMPFVKVDAEGMADKLLFKFVGMPETAF